MGSSSHRRTARGLAIGVSFAISLSSMPCSFASLPAFCHGRVPPSVRHGSLCSTPRSRLPLSASALKNKIGSSTSINSSHDHAQPAADFGGIGVEEGTQSYPVQVRHQGHVATIHVRKNEPILHALERHSTFSKEDNEIKGGKYSLALSHIPHECRRGNCLTCSSRVVATSEKENILANVDNGLSPTVASELTKSGHILTCCSFVTGPGLVLELDQNDQVWDLVYRKRICNTESKQIATEARARLLRRVDEENLGTWKRRMEDNWESQGDDE